MNHPPIPLRVLIVDDAKSLRGLLHALLRDNGYTVVAELEDGSQVAKTVERLQPDLVCLDLHMPGVDGMTVLADMTRLYPQVAVVMMTADHTPEVYRQATEAGAAGFLTKPFSPKQILDAMSHVASAIRLMQRKPASGTVPDFEPAGARVVIADDSSALRHLLRAILEEIGLEVVGEASNGQEAIELASQHKPDLVCLDIEMPVLNGLEALVRLHARMPELPIMMITSHADRPTVQQAAAKGARGYILKPYQPEKVQQGIRKLLNLS